MVAIKYTTACPVFPDHEIDVIMPQIRNILEGKAPLSMGSQVKSFEHDFAEYVGSSFALGMPTCSSALEVALASLGLKNGDEVVVPAETFVATASSVVRAGCKVVFADIDPDTFCLSLKTLQDKVSSKTRAVIVVHMAGLISPEIFAIRDFCRSQDIFLIEDAAHAHGASISGIKSGNIGDVGCFSFYPTKIMTTGEGGMLTTSNTGVHALANSLRQRGLDLSANQEIFINVGTNFRMTEIQAILGLSQLRCVDDFVRRRNQVAKIYLEELRDDELKERVELFHFPENIVNSYWRFLVKIPQTLDRGIVRKKMLERGIVVDWAYDPPVHLQPVFQKLYGTHVGQLPVAEKVMQSFLCLPIHANLTDTDARFVAASFHDVLGECL